jgi:hypothetical protein
MVDTPKVKRWIKLRLKRKRGLVERNRMGRILWACKRLKRSEEMAKGREDKGDKDGGGSGREMRMAEDHGSDSLLMNFNGNGMNFELLC